MVKKNIVDCQDIISPEFTTAPGFYGYGIRIKQRKPEMVDGKLKTFQPFLELHRMKGGNQDFSRCIQIPVGYWSEMFAKDKGMLSSLLKRYYAAHPNKQKER